MLGTHDSIATVAVKDLNAARKFYESTLGLQQIDSEEGEALTYRTGKSQMQVYRSQYAGTNKATVATWAVADVDGEVRALKAKGVPFERYDMPGMTHEGDVHVAGDMRVAWFKDPDGNIFSIISR